MALVAGHRIDQHHWAMTAATQRALATRALVPLGVLALIGCAGARSEPTRLPFTLTCRLEGDAPIVLRVSPALQQVETLDPRSGDVVNTITTREPPPELGGGIIDDTSVTISAEEVTWEERMYRPQFARESHRIDRRTLAYRREEAFQIDMGPEMAREIRTGQCTSLDGVQEGSAVTPSPR